MNMIILDIGSSTGGFTDCGLQNGVKEVYALDVGTNQLVWKLRNDERVHVMEKTNFRYATLDMFQFGQPEFVSIDVSFISLKHIFPALSHILKKDGYIVALIKAHDSHMSLKQLTYSPITGGVGNIEFLGCFQNNETQDCFIDVQKVVATAHQYFKG